LGVRELIISISPNPDIATPADRRLCTSPDPDKFAVPARNWNDIELKEWIAQQHWYQSIPLRNGILTPGLVDSPRRLRDLRLPSLVGKSVLDVGCNAGMYAFECERLGANRVVGVDIEEYSLRQAAVLKEVLGSRVEFHAMPLDRIGALGKFDYVLCIAVLHELPEPAAALQTLKTIAREVIYLEVALWKPLFGARRPRSRRTHNRRGWTLLPTRGLVQGVFADDFAVTYLGTSARYDLFRIASKTVPGQPSPRQSELT
jgi:SAM-dependent methyltransferase